MRDRPTHGYCPECREDSAIDAGRRCLWCGGPTEQRERRGGWKRPDLRGSKYTEPQLRALHVFHMRDGLSVNELARRTHEAAGYRSPGSAHSAISRGWKRLGLKPRDRIEQVRKTCTKHGLAPKHGRRPGYGTYKRRVVRGEADQPMCEGIRQNPPRKGDPCQRPAMKGSRFCSQHDPERAGARIAHLDQVHAATRDRLAATALPMAPFAAFVKRVWEEAGHPRGSGSAPRPASHGGKRLRPRPRLGQAAEGHHPAANRRARPRGGRRRACGPLLRPGPRGDCRVIEIETMSDLVKLLKTKDIRERGLDEAFLRAQGLASIGAVATELRRRGYEIEEYAEGGHGGFASLLFPPCPDGSYGGTSESCVCDHREAEYVTAIDSRDVGPLVEALRQILDPAETEDMSSSAWIDWAKRTARGALQPFTQENNDPRESA